MAKRTAAQKNRHDTINVMRDINQFFFDCYVKSFNGNDFKAGRDVVKDLILKGTNTQRDFDSCNQMMEACGRQMFEHQMTLGYEFNGTIYTVHKGSVPNCQSTDVLHDMELPQAAWDNMLKYNVWIHSGVIHSRISYVHPSTAKDAV